MLKQDILDAIEDSAGETGWVVASSRPVPTTNQPGDNPPHADAKARYEEVAPSGFLCTGEHPDEDSDDPIVFAVDVDGVRLHGDDAYHSSTASAAVAAARGGEAAHSAAVGFGSC